MNKPVSTFLFKGEIRTIIRRRVGLPYLKMIDISYFHQSIIPD